MKRARAEAYRSIFPQCGQTPKHAFGTAWPTKLPEGFQGTPAPPLPEASRRVGAAVSFPVPSAHLLHGSAARSQIERASSSAPGLPESGKTKSNEQPPEILRFSNRGPGLLTNRKNGYAQFLWIQGLSHALTERDSGCSIHGLRIPH